MFRLYMIRRDTVTPNFSSGLLFFFNVKLYLKRRCLHTNMVVLMPETHAASRGTCPKMDAGLLLDIKDRCFMLASLLQTATWDSCTGKGLAGFKTTSLAPKSSLHVLAKVLNVMILQTSS